jgi:hypothetical protein
MHLEFFSEKSIVFCNAKRIMGPAFPGATLPERFGD